MANPETKFNFTIKGINAAAAKVKGKKSIFRDATRKGLCVEVKANGHAAFYFRKMIRGTAINKWLGVFPDMPIELARDRVAVLLGDIARGIDVSPENKLTVRGSLSLIDFFDDWLERYSKPHRSGTWKNDQSLFKNWIKPDLGTRKLVTINLHDISTLHIKMGKEAGHRHANAMLQLVSIMFNVAKQWKLFSAENPQIGVKRFKEIKRERYLTQAEAPQFYAALAHKDTPEYARDFYLLALYTGQRKANVMAMEWKDIYLSEHRKKWVIPAASTKTKQVYEIPLIDQAVEILITRFEDSKAGNPWVFPAARGTGHRKINHKVWVAVLKIAGIKDFRIHDLRHTIASWQAMAGTSLHIIGRGLGHNSTTTTAQYAHLDIEPIRASMSNAGNLLVEAGKPKNIE